MNRADLSRAPHKSLQTAWTSTSIRVRMRMHNAHTKQRAACAVGVCVQELFLQLASNLRVFLLPMFDVRRTSRSGDSGQRVQSE